MFMNKRNTGYTPVILPSDSVVTLCEGWGILSAKNSKYSVWQKEMDFAGTLKKIVNDQDMLFGAMAVLSPPVANRLFGLWQAGAKQVRYT
jgi:hypothetical protein